MSDKPYPARVRYGTNPETGKPLLWWCGRHATKREAKAAREQARHDKPWETKPLSEMTGNELVDAYLADYELNNKYSSLDTARQSLKPFRAAFGGRPIASITRFEARAWAPTVPRSHMPRVTTMFNYAVDELEIIERSPFRGMGGRGRGRADKAPPTLKEMERLLDACDALGDYASQLRNFLEFASYTLLRPSELYELRWPDVDFRAHQIHKDRRLYRGRVDAPKTGRKTVPLAEPAEVILLRQPTRTRDDGLVFVGRAGNRLNASTMCQMWALVKARSGLGFTVYEVTKHRGVHSLYAAGISARTIAQMAGWEENTVNEMLKTYGHPDVAAQAEINAHYSKPDAKSDAEESKSQ